MAQPTPEERLPLTPAVFHILLALADESKHGYAIMKDVAEMTGGKMTMGPGTLYGTLKRMLQASLVADNGDAPDPELDDERRRYYQLTPLGRRVLRAEAQRLAHLVQVARTKRLIEDAA